MLRLARILPLTLALRLGTVQYFLTLQTFVAPAPCRLCPACSDKLIHAHARPDN